MKKRKNLNKRGQTRKFSLCNFSKNNRRGALEMSFGWLFAIIAGIFILFLAIYVITKFVSVEQTTIDAKTGKEIGILLNPLETSFETSKVTSFITPVETRIYNKCDESGIFGRQVIQISQKSFNKWTETNIDVGFSNKYIFSESYAEGKQFYVFSKPFEFPFKIADLIYMISSLEEYCFINPPGDIEDEISDLNQKNLLVENCSKDSIRVCFGGGLDCDVSVDYNAGYVEKDREKMYFGGDSLMYAAVFADKEIYECQLKRLMKRTGQLALIYKDKANFISKKGCYSNLNLLALSSSAENFEDSKDIDLVGLTAEEISIENEANGECRLW